MDYIRLERFGDYFDARVSKEKSLPVANKVHSMRETAFPARGCEELITDININQLIVITFI